MSNSISLNDTLRWDSSSQQQLFSSITVSGSPPAPHYSTSGQSKTTAAESKKGKFDPDSINNQLDDSGSADSTSHPLVNEDTGEDSRVSLINDIYISASTTSTSRSPYFDFAIAINNGINQGRLITIMSQSNYQSQQRNVVASDSGKALSSSSTTKRPKRMTKTTTAQSHSKNNLRSTFQTSSFGGGSFLTSTTPRSAQQWAPEITTSDPNTFVIGSPEQLSAAFSLASILMLVTAGLLSLALVIGTALICSRWRQKHLDRHARRFSLSNSGNSSGNHRSSLASAGRQILLSSSSEPASPRTRTRTSSLIGKSSLQSKPSNPNQGPYAEEDEAQGKRIAGLIPSPNVTLLRSENIKLKPGQTINVSAMGYVPNNQGSSNMSCLVTPVRLGANNNVWQPVPLLNSTNHSTSSSSGAESGISGTGEDGADLSPSSGGCTKPIKDNGLFREWYV